jgi:hypothetical protein
MKRVLILKEHHGERALDISTPEQLQKAALSVIKGRFGSDHDYYMLEEPELPESPIAKEQIDVMSEGELKEAAKEIYSNYERNLEGYNETIKEINLIRKCIETNDGRLAWKILQQRQYIEDEGFKVLEVEEVYSV